MTRSASVVLVLSLWFGVGLSAQYPGQSSLRTSAEREAVRLEQTLVADDSSSKGSRMCPESCGKAKWRNLLLT